MYSKSAPDVEKVIYTPVTAEGGTLYGGKTDTTAWYKDIAAHLYILSLKYWVHTEHIFLTDNGTFVSTTIKIYWYSYMYNNI